MPAYDNVLGSHLDTGAVDPRERDRAEQQYELATSNGDDLAAGDRQRELEVLAAIPGVVAEVALESEDLDRALVVIGRGTVSAYAIVESRAPDRVEPPASAYRPVVHPRGGAGSDDIVDVFRGVGVDDIDVHDDESVELPYRWPERAALRALARAAPLWSEPVVRALAEIEGRRYDIEIASAKGVTCRGLFLVSDDPAHAARFAKLAGIDQRESTTVLPLDKAPALAKVPPFDPQQPYTTGSAAKRADAWHEHTQYGRDLKTDPSRTIAAVRDPANRDRRFAELRRDMYHFLAKRDLPEAHDAFLWALREEDDETIATVIYVGWRLDGLIARLPDELRDASARGDARLVQRIRRLQKEAGA